MYFYWIKSDQIISFEKTIDFQPVSLFPYLIFYTLFYHLPVPRVQPGNLPPLALISLAWLTQCSGPPLKFCPPKNDRGRWGKVWLSMYLTKPQQSIIYRWKKLRSTNPETPKERLFIKVEILGPDCSYITFE